MLGCCMEEYYPIWSCRGIMVKDRVEVLFERSLFVQFGIVKPDSLGLGFLESMLEDTKSRWWISNMVA